MTTRQGVGISKASCEKQVQFRSLLLWHVSAAYPLTPYVYVDLNAGTGCQTEYNSGSPCIALDVLGSSGLHARTQFYEVDEGNCEQLRRRVTQRRYEGVQSEVVNADSRSLRWLPGVGAKDQGLIYSDTTGLPFLVLLERLSRSRLAQGLDILINVEFRAVNRNRHLRIKDPWIVTDIPGRIKRNSWFVCEPHGCWVMVLGSDRQFAETPSFLHSVDSERGSRIMQYVGETHRAKCKKLWGNVFTKWRQHDK